MQELIKDKSALFVLFGGPEHSLLGASVLGDCLGSLRDGVLGELTWQEEPDSSR